MQPSLEEDVHKTSTCISYLYFIPPPKGGLSSNFLSFCNSSINGFPFLRTAGLRDAATNREDCIFATGFVPARGSRDEARSYKRLDGHCPNVFVCKPFPGRAEALEELL